MPSLRSSAVSNSASLLLASVLAIAQCPRLSHAAPSNASATNPTTQATTGAAAQVPVREVVLYSSGVGYFEHFGTIKDNATTELSFKREQINDVLKSLLLEDLDKGLVSSVTYGSQSPLAHTLKSFEVDITANPPLADLLNQLRGARLSVSTQQQAQASGTILGVEKHQRPVPGDKSGGVIDTWVLNLVTDAGSIRPVELEQVSEVKLEDPKLQQELGKALMALAQSRDQDKKPVTVHFSGQGERRVRIGYVVETPVWKTSYRLVLPATPNAQPGAPAPGATTEPATSATTAPAMGATPLIAPASLVANPTTAPSTQPAGGAVVRAAADSGKLQGWAIIENQTDNDWQNVQLSLMSGRPISFIEDLYQPLYVPRPTVTPQLFASLRPQTYDEGMDLAKSSYVDRFSALRPGTQPLAASVGAGVSLKRSASSRERTVRAEGGGQQDAQEALDQPAGPTAAQQQQQAARQQEIDPAVSVASIASATKVGELFEYTVGNVTLARQQSAMVPIVTDAVSVKRLSIYNPSVMPRNPLLGARLTNDTGKLLPQGPLTVLDSGSYAGDANIEDLPNGQNRLISYGVDQQMLVNSTATQSEGSLLTGRIIKGVLELSFKRVMSQDYVSENKSDHAKTLLIEHPLRAGWKLVEPVKADETTDALYRFEGSVAPKHTSKLTVREEIVEAQQFAILSMDSGVLENYTRTGEIPQHVRDALIQAAKLKGNVTDAQREVQQRVQKIAEITAEQNRIRDNMKSVAQNSDYYQRLLKKLDQQESQIETLQGESKEWQQKQQAAQQALEQYVQGLDVSSASSAPAK